MIYSKLEPQSDEGSVDTDCSTTQNQIPRDEGSGAKVHLGQRMNPDGPLEAYDPGGGVALSDGADFERLDAARTTKIIGAKPTSCSMAMALKTMPLDGHLQAEESGEPCSHLKRPDDTKNHVRTTVSKTAGCGNDKYVRQARTSSPHEVIVYPVLPAHICCTASLTCIASRLNLYTCRRRETPRVSTRLSSSASPPPSSPPSSRASPKQAWRTDWRRSSIPSPRARRSGYR